MKVLVFREGAKFDISEMLTDECDYDVCERYREVIGDALNADAFQGDNQRCSCEWRHAEILISQV